MKIELTSPAFAGGREIPRKHTADGEDVSPPLEWGAPPEKTRGFALICEDPDAPRGTFTHWVIFNVPGDARGLPGGITPEPALGDGMLQGVNDFGRAGYGGPSPPPGKPHRYFFRL